MNFQTVRAQAIPGERWPFGPLVPFSYDLIMMDFPAPTKMRGAGGYAKSSVSKYGSMSWDELAEFPVGQLASRDCVLFLWTINNMVVHGGDPADHYRDADASQSRVGALVKAWGFRFATQGAWIKTTKHGKIAFGTGYRGRNAMDPWWICVTGAPKTSRALRNVFFGLAREHSRKPDEAFNWCERYMVPGSRLVEIFSRQSRPRWDTWGLEAGKFDPVVGLNATPLEAAA